jgi:hypothetical protein
MRKELSVPPKLRNKIYFTVVVVVVLLFKVGYVTNFGEMKAVLPKKSRSTYIGR